MPGPIILLMQVAMPGGMSMVDEFDLGRLPEESGLTFNVTDRCVNTDPNVILVCGIRDDGRYRVGEVVGPSEEEVIPKAEAELGGGVTGAVEVDSVGMANGEISKRAKITIRVPF